MAKIIVGRDQQAETRRRYPKPAYSRVIVQDLYCDASGTGTDFEISAPVGNRLWLLSVDVWIQAVTIGGLVNMWFQLKTGHAGVASILDVTFEWESVIDVAKHVDNHIYHWGASGHRRFDMMKFYEGQGRHFASVGQTFGASGDCAMSVAYQISEG